MKVSLAEPFWFPVILVALRREVSARLCSLAQHKRPAAKPFARTRVIGLRFDERSSTSFAKRCSRPGRSRSGSWCRLPSRPTVSALHGSPFR